jgi:glycosyltransferase involved in cell wall biosynthesis
VEPGSIRGLCEAVLRLLRDENLRKRIVTKARQDVVDEFSSARMATNIVEVYTDILGLAG